MATLVVLNGTSSSGKTTIARAFQDLSPRLFLNFSIDSILSSLPPSSLQRIVAGEPIDDLRLPGLVRAFYSCAGELLRLEHDLIIDHAVTARYHVESLLEASEGHDTLLVGLECPLEVLHQREVARGDRHRGLAERQCERIHSWLEYDLVVDSAGTSPHDAATQIIEAVAFGRRGGVERTRAKLRGAG